MQTVSIRGSNGQCSVNVRKELIEAAGWRDGDRIVVSKVPGRQNMIIENLTRGETMEKENLKERIVALEQENLALRETVEILSDKELMQRFATEKKRKTKPLSEIKKKYGY